jgi:hypothetical protein
MKDRQRLETGLNPRSYILCRKIINNKYYRGRKGQYCIGAFETLKNRSTLQDNLQLLVQLIRVLLFSGWGTLNREYLPIPA